MVDMAHYAGLIAGGQYPNPVPHADVVTSTTHKSCAAARGFHPDEGRAREKPSTAPSSRSAGRPADAHHRRQAIAFKEALSPEFKQYAAQVKKNAQVVAQTLTERGLRIVSGGTQSHVMLVDLRAKGITGRKPRPCWAAPMTINKNAIPNDLESPWSPAACASARRP